jgi:hypothetical protein
LDTLIWLMVLLGLTGCATSRHGKSAPISVSRAAGLNLGERVWDDVKPAELERAGFTGDQARHAVGSEPGAGACSGTYYLSSGGEVEQVVIVCRQSTFETAREVAQALLTAVSPVAPPLADVRSSSARGEIIDRQWDRSTDAYHVHGDLHVIPGAVWEVVVWAKPSYIKQ